ncbi:hypothetical protein [Xanthomonas pisi]|uniref:hypothetical protein n=1 Tax=Xanthomonas pisi TaxID=56457 RepID=UPI000AC5EA26|nr:hypothetical protein [Xanthomonas pisi]
MQARRLMLIATLTMGLLMNHPSAAVTPVGEVPHDGMSPQALERAYVESYEQSGFRLAGRDRQVDPGGTWTIDLVFQLNNAPKGPNEPGTTLRLSGSHPTLCACDLRRQSFVGPDADSPDLAAYVRGLRVLIEADAAALAEVRHRLGVSLPVVDMPTP